MEFQYCRGRASSPRDIMLATIAQEEQEELLLQDDKPKSAHVVSKAAHPIDTANPEPTILQTAFTPAATSNTLSSWGQYQALDYVSFALQTILKSTKIIPVMLMGTLLKGTVYTWMEYFEAIGITIGIVIFSSIIITTVALVLSGEVPQVVEFLVYNPTALYYNIITAVCSTTGQFAIFYTIKRFGPDVFTVIMTTRQMLSIVVSNYLFNHRMTMQSYVGAAIVFGVISYSIFRKIRDKQERDAARAAAATAGKTNPNGSNRAAAATGIAESSKEND